MAEDILNRKKFLKNVFFVVFSNLLTLLSGILIGIVIPKIMGISDFGYYKTFTLYSSYVGIFHFGFVDGILLVHAGCSKENLDLKRFRLLGKAMFIFELIITVLGSFISMFFLLNEYKLLFLFVSLNLFALNLTTHFEYIVQITMNFKQLSIRSLIKTSIQLLAVFVIFVLFKTINYIISPYVYICIVVSINYFLLSWYIITYRQYVFGETEKFDWNTLLFYLKKGFPIMCSNLLIMLIFAVDQIFVNVLFDKETYAYYAFAYSMISLITTTTNAISLVFFPTLKNIDDEQALDQYENFNAYILIFSALSLCCYQIFCFIVDSFLTKYLQSLPILRIVIPMVLITTPITVVKYNFYKKHNMVNLYFVISIIVLIASIVADIIVYYLYGNTISISIVSIVVCLIWNFVIELIFCIRKRKKWMKNLTFMILILAFYYGISFIPNLIISFLSYLFVSFAMVFIFYFHVLRDNFLKKGVQEHNE